MTNNRLTFLESRIESLSEDLDPGDVLAILEMIWDSEDSGIPLAEWIQSSILARDIIQFTQSNPKKAMNRIRRISVLYDAISRYDPGMPIED